MVPMYICTYCLAKTPIPVTFNQVAQHVSSMLKLLQKVGQLIVFPESYAYTVFARYNIVTVAIAVKLPNVYTRVGVMYRNVNVISKVAKQVYILSLGKTLYGLAYVDVQ